MNITPNRAVTVLTPAIFAPLAGAISVFAADKAGVDVSPMELTAIFIAGATIAFAKAGLWLKGWQDFEKRQEHLPADALEDANGATALGADDEPNLDAGDEPEAAVDDEPQFDHEPDLDDEPEDEDQDELLAVAPLASAAQG